MTWYLGAITQMIHWVERISHQLLTKNGDQDQALTNFIAEFIYDVAPNHEMEALKEQNQDDDVAKWNLFVDGSSN